MLDPGLVLGLETGLEIFPASSLSALWGLASLPFPHIHTSAVSDSWRPVSTNLSGQGSLFALPRAKPGGPDPEVLCYSDKKFLSLPASTYEGEIKPETYALMAPSQVLRCHVWGAAPQGRVQPQGNRSLLPLPASGGGGGGPPPVPTHPKGPSVPQHHPRIFSSSQISALRTEWGLELRLAQWRPGPGCWVSIPVRGGAGAGAFQPREPPECSRHGLWPGALASVCFEKVRRFWILRGMYCSTSEFWSGLGSPGEACTSLSRLHLVGVSQDQVRAELWRPAA